MPEGPRGRAAHRMPKLVAVHHEYVRHGAEARPTLGEPPQKVAPELPLLVLGAPEPGHHREPPSARREVPPEERERRREVAGSPVPRLATYKHCRVVHPGWQVGKTNKYNTNMHA